VTDSHPAIPANHSGLVATIHAAAALLPAQGPITSFVFLNPLQGLEHLPFDEAVQQGADLLGCEPYLSEERYAAKREAGRIGPHDLEAVIREELGPLADLAVGPSGTIRDLRQLMLEHPLLNGSDPELDWFVNETKALERLRRDVSAPARERFLQKSRVWLLAEFTRFGGWPPRLIQDSETPPPLGLDPNRAELWSDPEWERTALWSLWQICQRLSRLAPHPSPPLPPQTADAPNRWRDRLLVAGGSDSDLPVHEHLIRFCAAYTDQGFANWQLPGKRLGFWHAFQQLYSGPLSPEEEWCRGLGDELLRLQKAGVTPLESLAQTLSELEPDPARHPALLQGSLLALRGWAGLLWQLETRPDRVPRGVPPGTLVEFLAVRLLLDRYSVIATARNLWQTSVELAELADRLTPQPSPRPPIVPRAVALRLFHLAQLAGWSGGDLEALSDSEWQRLNGEIHSFDTRARRRTLHRALELRFRQTALRAIAERARHPEWSVRSPQFQAVFCIDTREESFRRHLEEVCPEVETYGAAGFFGVPIYYRGVGDAGFTALCPIVIRPEHWLVEDVVYTQADIERRRQRARRALGRASQRVTEGTRGLASGALLTGGLGVLATIPLVASILFPRWTSRLHQFARSWIQPSRMTRLRLERSAAQPGPTGDGIGFSLEEMTQLAEKTLRDLGLTHQFARLVFFFGHGSFCLNNPHKSAYDCGACSGGAGGPNARALAAMLNDVRVRGNLEQRGIFIPRDTIFLGGLHNTCTDHLTFYELELLPVSHHPDFERARHALELACERNSHERCRRFDSAPLGLTAAASHRHVEARSVDLAQTRPEFGNATNALCVVGRRGRTRGLYLDRRSFLVSYDPTQDDANDSILARILGAVVPVCSGINLLYFFSYIDPSGWGAGTKLPHNVTSLLGVMDGASSDLRTGLPWQGVEIHEPLRLLFVIESTPAAIESIMRRNETVRRILQNGWVQLALLDPQSEQLLLYSERRFEPWQPPPGDLPRTPTSADWYRGHREHLPFARIGSWPTNPPRSGAAP